MHATKYCLHKASCQVSIVHNGGNKHVLSYSTQVEDKSEDRYAIGASSLMRRECISLYPKSEMPKNIDPTSPSIRSLDTVWDINRFKTIHPAFKIKDEKCK